MSGLPKGVTAAFTQNPTASASTLTLTASPAAPIGEYAITITGVYGLLTHETFITVTTTK